MIQQIQLVLSPPNDVRIPQSWSYRLYGWLVSQISSARGTSNCAFSMLFAGKTVFDLDGQPAE